MMAWSDWAMLIAFNFPIQVTTPFICLFARSCGFTDILWNVVGSSAFLVGFSGVLAIFVDLIRGRFTSAGVLIDTNFQSRINDCLNQVGVRIPDAILSRSRVLKTDLALGAHVRGVFRPYFVISGGLLVGLLRKDPRALAILCHEMAHVQHFDRILPGMIGLSIFEFLGELFVPLADGGSSYSLLNIGVVAVSYKMLVLSLIVSVVSKYREYYADAKAIAVTGEKSVYRALLSDAVGQECRSFSFFHPSLVQRIAQVDNDFRVLRNVTFWRIFWPLNLFISWLQWATSRYGGSIDATYEKFVGSAILVCAFCIVFTFSRGIFFPHRADQA